jgi:hypothetical protein
MKVRQDHRLRIYSLRSDRLAEVDAWISKFRGFWGTELGSLEAHLNARKRLRAGKAP